MFGVSLFKEPLEKMSRSRFCKHPTFQREATFALVIIKNNHVGTCAHG